MSEKLRQTSTEELLKLKKTLEEQLVVGPPLSSDQRVEALEQQIQEVLNQINVINAKLEVLTGSAQPTGAVEPMQEQQGEELTVEEIKQKIENVQTQINDLDKQLEEISEEREEERQEIRTKIDVLYAELNAYKTALETKIADQTAREQPPATQAEVKAESIVALRKKLVDIEAQLANIEKQKTREATDWKEKYQKLHEAVKGAIPPPRIWKSWTLGPQRYVQENLKILRERGSR